MEICIIASKFNQAISEKLISGAQKALKELDVKEAPVYRVPGAYELPLACTWLADKYDALVALGTVIKGETPHFDYVCLAASQGIAEVSRNKNIPIGFGVITANTVDQAAVRSADNENNFGYKAAQAAIEMIKVKEIIK